MTAKKKKKKGLSSSLGLREARHVALKAPCHVPFSAFQRRRYQLRNISSPSWKQGQSEPSNYQHEERAAGRPVSPK